MRNLSASNSYTTLIAGIGTILEEGRKHAVVAVNQVLVRTYWEIGKRMVEYEQEGSEKAEYGSRLLEQLSNDLKAKYGKGFNLRNVYLMRKFYLGYKNLQTLSAELSWSHYVELIGTEEQLARGFYEKQCIKEKWSVRELKRQIDSMLFHRIALSNNKKGVLELAKKGREVENPKDAVKDPYILEFLGIPEKAEYSERELEQKIIDNLQKFLLELGKGFAFVGRQYRISFEGEHFYVDLVFYNTNLKCFVLIDLKAGKVTPQDVGQMNMYLNYFKSEESSGEDSEPIGIILSAKKDNILVRYALGSITNKLFISKYALYLPDKDELEHKLKVLMEEK